MHESPIKRRVTRKIRVGNIFVGGDAPITVQTMTNTETCDVAATVAQIQRCVSAGADIVRVSVPSMEAAAAFGQIRQQVPGVPLVADIHFDHRIALAVAEQGVDCLRINPGNIGSDDKVREVVAAARHHGIPIRIGVNAGSLEKDLLAVYQELAQRCDNPLHLGLTEAGVFRSGTVKSAVAMGGLLLSGIGDTLRVSLAAEPEDEVKVGFDILKSLGIRSNGINFIACPSCSRQEFDVIRVMNALEARLEDVRTPMDVSVIGCKVNGPGEAKEADIGVVGALPKSLVYRNGEKSHLIDTNNLVDEIEAMVRAKVADKAAADAKLIVKASAE